MLFKNILLSGLIFAIS